MTVLHSGSTKKFATGWDAIFSGRKSSRAGAGQAAVKKVKRPTAKKPKRAAKAAGRRAK
jgi:hypothetical protein